MKLSTRTHSMVQVLKDINLKEIVEILEGVTDPVECLVNAKICPRSRLCATRDTWGEMKIAADCVLVSTTLQDLAERQKNKEKNRKYVLYIRL